MNIADKIKVLNDHGVPNKVVDGRLIADSMLAYTAAFEETEDVTDWSKAQLYAWLGY